MRPGAPPLPFCVWQLLQLPLVCDAPIARSRPGLWIDQFDGQGAPMTGAVPASIVYHLFLAFSELLRLEPRLRTLSAAPE